MKANQHSSSPKDMCLESAQKLEIGITLGLHHTSIINGNGQLIISCLLLPKSKPFLTVKAGHEKQEPPARAHML